MFFKVVVNICERVSVFQYIKTFGIVFWNNVKYKGRHSITCKNIVNEPLFVLVIQNPPYCFFIRRCDNADRFRPSVWEQLSGSLGSHYLESLLLRRRLGWFTVVNVFVFVYPSTIVSVLPFGLFQGIHVIEENLRYPIFFRNRGETVALFLT